MKLSFSTRGWEDLGFDALIETAEEMRFSGIEVYNLPVRADLTGKGGAFPSGITVGRVTELRSEAGGQSYYAVVDPAVDLSLLSQVFIIKDFEVIE